MIGTSKSHGVGALNIEVTSRATTIDVAELITFLMIVIRVATSAPPLIFTSNPRLEAMWDGASPRLPLRKLHAAFPVNTNGMNELTSNLKIVAQTTLITSDVKSTDSGDHRVPRVECANLCL
jgi:hypothetical protein